MKFYEKYYKSNYEELITYYPRYYRDVYEMVEILKAFGRISDGLEAEIEQAYLNNFILTADAETVKIWEKVLGITYKEKLTLDQRKSVVIGRISGYGHIGEPEIRGIIANYTENAVAVDFARGVITIVIDGEIFDENNLLETLLRRIPAHLELDMSVRIERTFRQRIDFCYGGATGSYFNPAPVGEDRTATAPLTVGYSGLLTSSGTGIPPNTKRASTGRTEGAGGMFYHTHVKSKLIG